MRERRRARASGGDGCGKVLFTPRRLFSRAQRTADVSLKGGSGIANRHRADQTACRCSQSRESENARNRTEVSLQFCSSQEKTPPESELLLVRRDVTHSSSRDDVLRRVEGVVSGPPPRRAPPARSPASTAGPAGRVRRPRSPPRSGVQVRAAAPTIRRGDARRSTRVTGDAARDSG